MKRIFIALAAVICVVAVSFSAVSLTAVTAADEKYSGLDAVTAAQLDNTDSYFYDRINERQQKCYNWLKDNYESFDGEPGRYRFDISSWLPQGATEEDYRLLGEDFIVGDLALRADFPLYELAGKVTGHGGGYDAELGRIHYVLEVYHLEVNTDEAKKQVEARIKQIVETVGDGDRYTKLYKLSHYILTNAFYDPYSELNSIAKYEDAFSWKGFYYDQSCYGLFIDNIAVCTGFAHTVKILCDELNIPCILIGNNSHLWNMVQMEDGSWYHFDLTRDRLGWDGTTDLTDFYLNYFLKIDQWESRHTPPYYVIALNNVYYADEFPKEADKHYVYTGATADFSYTVAQSTYVPCEPTFVYKVNRDGTTCTIINYEGREEGDLVIPEKIDGYTVTGIDPFAFYYCTGFTGKLVVPDTVRTIGNGAFTGCYNLTALELSKNLSKIGEGAFAGCKGLTEVVLPDSVLSVGSIAFLDCDKLTSVTFGVHIIEVGFRAFAEINSAVVLKAPADSAVQKYASENDISFEKHGEMCSFTDADGDWEFEADEHFHVCAHGVRVDVQNHSKNNENIVNCGDECDICGAQYCSEIGFVEKLETTLENARPATCLSSEYTGDVICPCGCPIRPGEYVGEPLSEHTSDGAWIADAANNSHYQICKHCSVRFNEAAHSGGQSTVSEKAKCKYCGAEYGEPVYHEHKGGTATATSQARCEICGKYYGARLPADSDADEKDVSTDGQGDAAAPDPAVFIIIGAAAAVLLTVTVILIVVIKKKRTKAAKSEE